MSFQIRQYRPLRPVGRTHKDVVEMKILEFFGHIVYLFKALRRESPLVVLAVIAGGVPHCLGVPGNINF
jgi:hypothetical protein